MSINSLLRWFLTLLIIVVACVFCYIRYNACLLYTSCTP